MVLVERRDVKLLDGAHVTYARMLAAIAAARARVHLEAYSFHDDTVGRRFIRALADAAARGVEVDVTIDAWGSISHAHAVVAALAKHGCRARIHNRLLGAFFGRLGRNHRKLLVVDDQLAVVGGINIGERFLDWEDVAVELRGPMCATLGRRLRGERHVEQHDRLRVHLSHRGGGRRMFRRYVKAIAGAQHRLLVAHSYFLPARPLVRALKAAAARGVEVTLLLPGRSDVTGARAAMSSVVDELLHADVHVFEWPRTVLHAKLAVIDDARLLVGSFNLDPLSLANLEALLVADDPALARAGARWIDERVARARPLVPSSRWTSRIIRAFGRVLAWLVVLIARLLRR
jgi:cardiolipin synthase